MKFGCQKIAKWLLQLQNSEFFLILKKVEVLKFEKFEKQLLPLKLSKIVCCYGCFDFLVNLAINSFLHFFLYFPVCGGKNIELPKR